MDVASSLHDETVLRAEDTHKDARIVSIHTKYSSLKTDLFYYKQRLFIQYIFIIYRVYIKTTSINTTIIIIIILFPFSPLPPERPN